MSGGRQTGTVPKTKHNSRARRENPVNHIPNNLDWHETYTPQRVRKESNTNARLSDAGEDGFIYEDNPWVGLAPSNRTDDDELRWSNVKSSNITPERGNSSTNVEGYLTNRTMPRQDNSVAEEREIPSTSKETLSRGRLKLKMEHSQRKIEELQQTQAALLSLRNKAIQQVKPVQMEAIQAHSELLGLRNKSMQQVKPSQVELDRMANMEARLQTMQDYANIMQALERDETTANLVEPGDIQCDQQLRIKLNELLAKKAQCDNILACIESENLPGGAPSVSSDDGEASQFSRPRQGFCEVEDSGSRRDVNKQDNRELEHHSAPSANYIHNKELKLEEVKNKLEQLQTLLNRVETLREGKPNPRIGEGAHIDLQQPCKNCPPISVLEKLHTKKIDLDQDMRKMKTFQSPQGPFHYNPPPPPPAAVQSWTSSVNGATASVDYSSDEGDMEYDESPVKLCSTTYHQPNSFPKTSTNSHPPVPKAPSGPGREVRRTSIRDVRGRVPRASEHDVRELAPNTSALADQISELQAQMEQMQILYQGMLQKQQVANFPPPPPPQPWLPQPNLGFMQFMTPPSPQWHQHQLLINSLNQCCQLIWHQQRELAGLRQALSMIQDESRMCKCADHGNNLNFDPSGLLWAQSTPQMLNNQVPPGNRANNYWDNFRSYSRQNLLSGRNKSNEGSIAESFPVPRPSLQTDNLRRRKENHSLINSQVNGSQMHSAEVSGSLNSGRSRRRYNSNLKADATAVFSLEQSIYSELETVIAQAERSPQVLLQLLTQLKNLRSQRPSPYEDGNPVGFENDSDLIEHGLPSYPTVPARIEEPRNHHMDCRRKHDSVMEGLAGLIERQESDACTNEVITELIGYLCRTLVLDGNTETSLHTALAKFKGTRLRQATDSILCTISRVLNNQGMHPLPGCINDMEDIGIEQIEEEGAVGGLPLAPSQSKPPSVEAELAEADQTQCNSADNIEVFVADEGGLPNVELDNQELPPREENQEHLILDP